MAKAKAKIRAKIKSKVRSSSQVKIKTKRAAAKRYKVLGSGDVKVPHCNRRHLTGKKARHLKNRLRKPKILGASVKLLVSRCLPNSL